MTVSQGGMKGLLTKGCLLLLLVPVPKLLHPNASEIAGADRETSKILEIAGAD